MKIALKILSYVFIFLLCLMGIVGALYVNEKFILKAPAEARKDALRSGIHTLELYPYTGFHVQANYHHVGDMSENQPYHDYDIKTGDLGFFDFSLKEPYPKKPHEFRIIWTGGSGAQGWGARTNDDMMYKLIPKYLNEKLAHCNVEISLFNLAMGSSKSYQNFIALNQWGHRLNPDMIISYSGRNDVNVPFNYMNDAFYSFNPLNAYVLASRPAQDNSGAMAWLGKHFPSTMEYTQLGAALRILFSYDSYYEQALRKYPELTGKGKYAQDIPHNEYNAFAKKYFHDVVQSDYANAMKSIKRDYNGIPMVIAWQSVKDSEWKDAGLTSSLGADFYQNWYGDVQHDLGHYMNDQWSFYNVDKFMQGHPDENTGTHQGNAGQKIISQYLAEQLAPVIIKLKSPSCRP